MLAPYVQDQVAPIVSVNSEAQDWPAVSQKNLYFRWLRYFPPEILLAN